MPRRRLKHLVRYNGMLKYAICWINVEIHARGCLLRDIILANHETDDSWQQTERKNVLWKTGFHSTSHCENFMRYARKIGDSTLKVRDFRGTYGNSLYGSDFASVRVRS